MNNSNNKENQIVSTLPLIENGIDTIFVFILFRLQAHGSVNNVNDEACHWIEQYNTTYQQGFTVFWLSSAQEECNELIAW